MMEWVLGIGGVVLLTWIFANLTDTNARRVTELLDGLPHISGFNADSINEVPNYVRGVHPGRCRLSFNVDRSLVRITGVTIHPRQIFFDKVYAAEDIISVELREGTETISKTVRSGGLGRAAVGGILLGGVGAIVGATTAGSNTVSKTKLTSITVIIMVDDDNTPMIDIELIDRPVKRDNVKYLAAMPIAENVVSLLKLMIHRTERAALTGSNVPEPTKNGSDFVAQISQLSELYNSGQLSLAEFEVAKERLLG